MKKKIPQQLCYESRNAGFHTSLGGVERGGEHGVARSAHDMCQAAEHMEKVCGTRSRPLLVGPALRCRAPWDRQGQTKPPHS